MDPASDFNKITSRLREFMATAFEQSASPGRKEDAFQELALDLYRLQFAHNPVYRRFCLGRHTTPDEVTSWAAIPAMPTTAFKELDITCLAPEERTAVFYSSGTTGQARSKHWHSAESLALYEESLLNWFRNRCLAGVRLPAWSGETWKEMRKARAFGDELDSLTLALLTPSPQQAPHSSLVHMFETIRGHWGSAESVFLGETDDEGCEGLHKNPTSGGEVAGWRIDVGRAVRKMQDIAKSGQPILILGTAFSYVQLLDSMEEQGLALKLPPGSRALETGGYKGRSRALSKADLHDLMRRGLGLNEKDIVCEYGMSELSSQAYDVDDAERGGGQECPRSGAELNRPPFRFPPWARAQVVSPETGREVGDGETGLLRVFDLANVYSVLAIQTEDLAVRRGKGFELLGRAPESLPRGCSLMAV